jgi:small-conductance mechanosensitive channel
MNIFDSAIAWLSMVWQDWSTLIRIGLILVGAIILRALLLVSVKKVVKGIVGGAKNKSASSGALAQARLVQRARTMGSVLGNLITWTVYTIAITMILSELGVAVGALIAGAGIIGAALGFGAQNLVRDLLSGLFIVLEDQYGVGDKVDLGEASGVVENVGLRVTQLRDSKGTLWYVRNGEILRVGNSSHKLAEAKNKK